MYHSCQLFFETPYKTLKFQQKLLPQQTKKKTTNKHDRMKVFSSDIHGKIMFTNNLEATYDFKVRKNVGNAFSDNLET